MEKQVLSPPFFLFEGASLDIFAELAALEAYIEPQDWQDKIYQVFDSNGRKLIFHLNTETKRIFFSDVKIEHVRFKEAEISVDTHDEFANCLKKAYQAYFGKNGNRLDSPKMLQLLIEKIGVMS